MTYARTPSDKSSKGSIGIQAEQGRLKANFPRQYFGGRQVRKGLSLPDTPEGHAKANLVVRHLQLDLEQGKLNDGYGNFNEIRFQEILCEHGIKANLRVIKGGTARASDQLPPKPELSILEIWDMYCEYKKSNLAITTYENEYCTVYRNYFINAIKSVGEDSIAMRNWLLANRSQSITKKALSALSKAYAMAIRQRLILHNPFDGLCDDIETARRKKVINQADEIEDDSDILNKSKSFTWEEAEEILNYIQSRKKTRHWYSFIKFKFLTGCRTGEAIAFWWCDVKWNEECIIIRRNYSRACKVFKPTKNETNRIFPMPKNGELWNLLKSIPEGQPNECVFKSKQGKIINSAVLSVAWGGSEKYKMQGIIPYLVKEGKVNKYLPCYNTRHTFITHQIFDLGRDEKIVNAWCEHSEETSKKHYQDIMAKAIQTNPDLPNNQQTEIITSEVDSLKKIIKSLQDQLKVQSELIAKLQLQVKQQK
ncbi:hypothetical protein BZZ01_32405 [Nostocales cyanobacterium HT-58-2]|nr:hypothetical protein BZZ01_32405 [Nostocales cyanobacterium HT-58-2]